MRCMEFVVITACGIFPDEEVSLCPLPGQWILNHWMPREVPLPVCSVLVLIFVVGGFLGWDLSEHGFTLSGVLGVVLHSSPVAILDTFQPVEWGVHLSVSYLFAILHSSWGSRIKNTGVVCHSVFQQIMFCQSSSLWHVCHWWSYTKWLIDSLSYASLFSTQHSNPWRV